MTHCDVYTSAKEKLAREGYTMLKERNTWDSDIYKGINTNVQAPDGTVFELQFHTEESFYTKEVLNHKHYEIARSPGATQSEIETATEIMKQNTSKIRVPEGVLKLKQK